MKPTLIVEHQDNAPAVIFRPTFHVTGKMLQHCILSLLYEKPNSKVTEDHVKTEMLNMLTWRGMSEFKDEYPEILEGDAGPDLVKKAEAFAKTMYPDFFNMTRDEALAEFAYILEHKGPKPEKPLPEVKENDSTGTQEAAEGSKKVQTPDNTTSPEKTKNTRKKAAPKGTERSGPPAGVQSVPQRKMRGGFAEED